MFIFLKSFVYSKIYLSHCSNKYKSTSKSPLKEYNKYLNQLFVYFAVFSFNKEKNYFAL